MAELKSLMINLSRKVENLQLQQNIRHDEQVAISMPDPVRDFGFKMPLTTLEEFLEFDLKLNDKNIGKKFVSFLNFYKVSLRFSVIFVNYYCNILFLGLIYKKFDRSSH